MDYVREPRSTSTQLTAARSGGRGHPARLRGSLCLLMSMAFLASFACLCEDIGMPQQSWLLYAILSAVAAAFVGIFGKLGMNKVDSNLATGVRSVVMTLFLLGVITAMGLWNKAGELRGWPLYSIVLSGVAGAISWLFYFRAIQLGQVSQVAPIDKLSMPFAVILAVILLHEKFAWYNWLGVAIIVAGAYLASISPK